MKTPKKRRQSELPAAALKRLGDMLGGGVLLLLGLPFLPAVALAIRLDSPGPIFFRQERLGRGGRPFSMWKLRTMRADAACLPTPARKSPMDPRITRFGRWLRRASLDELPQAWNILRGEMSLVGPRPLTARETAELGPHAWRRLEVRPGLTGLWQVQGRSDLPPERLLELDLRYLEQRSFWLDCRILLRTLPAVIAGRGAY